MFGTISPSCGLEPQKPGEVNTVSHDSSQCIATKLPPVGHPKLVVQYLEDHPS